MSAGPYFVQRTTMRARRIGAKDSQSIWTVRLKIPNGWEMAVFQGSERQCRNVAEVLNFLGEI